MKQRLTKSVFLINLLFKDNIILKSICGMIYKSLLFFILLSLLLSCHFYKLAGQSESKGLFFNNPETNSIKVPFKFVNNLIIIPLEINNSDSLHFILDTGASLSAWLMKETKSDISIPDKTIDSHLGHGLGGEISGKMGRINKLSIGNYVLPQVIISYPDSGSISYNFNNSKRNGTIGAEILRRFRVIIDYKNNRINLKPNYNYRQKFTYNMSGIQIASPYTGFPLYIIDHIIPGSAGDKAGLLPGDQIFELNNKLAFKLSLNDIISTFTSNPGKTISLTILRNGKKFFYKMKFIPEI